MKQVAETPCSLGNSQILSSNGNGIEIREPKFNHNHKKSQ